MSRLSGGASGSPGVAAAIRAVFAGDGEGHALDDPGFGDVPGAVRRLRYEGRELVAKLRSRPAAHAERSLAAEAARRLGALTVDGFGRIEVCVPGLVPLDDCSAALVSPYLGIPLSASTDGLAGLSVEEIEDLLLVVLARGVEASGCIPRNMFRHSGRTVLIDWEDTLLVPAGTAAPGALTVMKWDIAWSDLFGRDLGLRRRLTAGNGNEPTLDGFESILAAWLPAEPAAREVRRRGIELTLASELPVAGAKSASAARLGHLAEDVLPPRLGVFHTVLTSLLRADQGEDAYADLLHRLDALTESAGADCGRGLERLRRPWVLALFSTAENRLTAGLPSIEQLAARLEELRGVGGWDAACERAEVAEEVTARIARTAQALLGLEELELILRGSCAQGVLGRGSDVDFELSSPDHPDGHRALEDLVIEVLACLGLAAEGSAARPTERDVVSADGMLSRDLHEWFELRRPGVDHHSPGWVATAIAAPSTTVISWPSEYEQQGRELTAKYLWFESRAMLARLVFARSTAAPPPVKLVPQLSLLHELVPGDEAAEVAALVRRTFALREAADPALPTTSLETKVAQLADQLDVLRRRLGLPGPRNL
ncbi:hypothetical protein PUR71_01895 [Streptomyces sp. SP17BM10]|uniref:hypothetical protein n=1 Tax=Streptomyces sp. SP17BM10 TaxID=3002530 RepID=UPI002E7A8188|nr:hypothetical protein [Streptomyces sp. SP17BM10]MEE1781693.1 hypothetical protein [Streptomyces sp. SP17BM10]